MLTASLDEQSGSCKMPSMHHGPIGSRRDGVESALEARYQHRFQVIAHVEDAPSEDVALMKKSLSGCVLSTSGSSDKMGSSGSFGSLFSIRSSWKRFGVSCRVSLRPECAAKRREG